MIPKFRVWEHDVKFMNDQVRITYNRFGGNKIFVEVTEGVDWKDVDEKYLMQSTGLHDVNGKEIFEGDILEIKDHPYQRSTGRLSGLKTGIEIDGYYLIQYDREIAGYVVGDWKTREVIRYCTVIGNIHEHSHLLEE